MAIDADLVVEIDGGKVFFKSPGLNEFAFLSAFADKTTPEQAELLLAKVTKVEGLSKADGTPVDKSNLDECSLFFFKNLIDSWVTEIHKAMGIKAEEGEKNVPTPASSGS